MNRRIIAAVAAVLLAAGCAGGTTTTTGQSDSYVQYRQTAPDDAPYLTRSEAAVTVANACQDAAEGTDHSTAHSLPGTMEYALIRAYGC